MRHGLGHHEIQKLNEHFFHYEEGLRISSENCKALGWHGFAGEGVEAGDLEYVVGGHVLDLHEF